MQPNAYLSNIHYKSENQINYLAGGINNIYPPQNIQDDECQDMYNMCLDKYPAIRTKIGRTLKANPRIIRISSKILWSCRNKLPILYSRYRLKRYDRYCNCNRNYWK